MRRFVTVWTAAVAVLVASAALPAADLVALDAPAASVAAAQPPAGEIQVDVDVDRGGGAWWTSPVWIAIGVIALVLLIAIVAMAARGGGTTVIKD